MSLLQRDEGDGVSCSTDEEEDGPPPSSSSRSSSRRAARGAPSRAAPNRTTSSGGLSDSGDSQDFGYITAPSLGHCLYGTLTDNNNLEDPDDCLDEDDYYNYTEQAVAPHHVIHGKYLRKLASRGIPDEGSHRALAWRVLLGYLPEETDQWGSTMKTNRNFYKSLVKDLFADTLDAQNGDALRWRPRQRLRQHVRVESIDDDEGGGAEEAYSDDASSLEDVALPPAPSPLSRPAPVTPDLPDAIRQAWKARGKDEHLLNNLNSTYNALKIPAAVETPADNDNTLSHDDQDDPRTRAINNYIESAVLLDEVRKDVVRTHPDLAFFLEPTEDLGLRRYHAIERILFVWATFNKGVRYVQGMNEIVGAMYYVMAKDWKQEWAAEAEADTYYLFSILLAEMRDVFMSEMDDEETGIQGRLAHMQKLLKLHDPEVQEHLQEVGVDVSYYAVRWWTTLLSREFLLPDTIRLWDSMFASTHKDNFMRYVCVTMVLIIRDKLLKGDFSTCIKLLQAYPPTHMDNLIEASRALWVYETQVQLAIHKGGFTRHMALQTIQPPPAIIMAFGFRKGIAPKTRAEILEEASGKAADRVRGAASAAMSYFGKAFTAARRRTTSSESVSTGEGLEEVRFSEDKLKAFEDDKYMAEFMGS